MADRTGPYKVVQWATGNIGARSLRGVVEHPDMTLTGLFVYSPEKEGRDAGELCGLRPTGVVATGDIEDIIGLDEICGVRGLGRFSRRWILYCAFDSVRASCDADHQG